MSERGPALQIWADRALAAQLIAVDPGLGGVVVKAGAGPVRDAWLAQLLTLLPAGTPVRRMPAGIGDERLLGGLDLAATLRAGRPIADTGLLASADGGIVVLPMAERVSGATAARIVGVMDRKQVDVQRDGFASSAVARFAVVALDEGQDETEAVPAAVADRLGLHVVLDGVGLRDVVDFGVSAEDIAAARARLPSLGEPADLVATLVTVAARLGVASLRAPWLALRAARAAAALRGSDRVEAPDVNVAARLVLAPRATMLPEQQDDGAGDTDDADPQPPEEQQADDALGADDGDRTALDEQVLQAARAAIPRGLLAQLEAGASPRQTRPEQAGAGARTESRRRGRPVSPRPGDPRTGRLALVATLRAAAPWQRLRKLAAPGHDETRLIVRAEDFRIQRYRRQRETAAIFVVDASGSAAMHRLAEVKGAIELLLADCYARRDQVALVAFRGTGAEIVLPPTRSLARAKRMVAALPGGGGTPIATGLETALGLADSERRKGRSPLLVLMTDGRANIGRDGTAGRLRAFEDALLAGRKIRAAGFPALAIDTAASFVASAEAPVLRLGEAMNARYIKLPYADAGRVSDAVRAATPAT